VTHQTGPEGRIVRRILVEEALEIEAEYYFGIVVDRSVARPVLMASRGGGVEIEKVAAESPERIVKLAIDPRIGFSPFLGRKLAYGLDIRRASVAKAVATFAALYRAFVETDASLVEVNPFVITRDGRAVA